MDWFNILVYRKAAANKLVCFTIIVINKEIMFEGLNIVSVL